MTKDKKLMIAAAVLCISGVLLIWLGLSMEAFGKEFLVAVGQALVGSGAVGFFIDRAARKDFIENTVRDAFGYIVGNNLPFALRHKIDEIVHSGLVNEEFSQNYTIKQLSKDSVTWLIETRWLVRNYSLNDETHRTELFVLQSECPVFTQLACFSEDKETIHYQQDAAALKDAIEQIGDKSVVRSEERKLRPRGKDGSAFYVVWRYEITKPINDSDIISFGATTVGVSVSVQADAGVLAVELESLNKYRKLYDHQWAFDKSQVFFKEQHIRLRWWPKSI